MLKITRYIDHLQQWNFARKPIVKMVKSSLIALFVLLVVFQVVNSYQAEVDYPAKPEKFDNGEQLKDYLNKMHEYLAIIGRPR